MHSDRPSDSRARSTQLSPFHVLVLVGLSFLLMLLSLHALAFAWSVLAHRAWSVALGEVSGNVGCLGLAQLIGLGLPALMLLRFTAGGALTGLREAFAPTDAKHLGFAFLAGIALQLPMCEVAQLVSQFAPSLAPSAADEARMQSLLAIDSLYRACAVPLALVVIAPFTEELLFRHFVQRSFLAHAPRAVVIPVVAMLFAGFHLDPHAFLSITMAGLALGALAHKHHSIRISLAMHAGVNLVPVLVQPSWLAIPGLNSGAAHDHVPVLWLGPSALLFVVFFALAMTPRR